MPWGAELALELVTKIINLLNMATPIIIMPWGAELAGIGYQNYY